MASNTDYEVLKEKVKRQDAKIELLSNQIINLMDRLESLDNMKTNLEKELLLYQKKPCDSCRNCLYIADGRGGHDDRPVGYYHVYVNPSTIDYYSGNFLVHPYGDICNCNCHPK
ncbi:unnamed protein product [Adineta ricciae]|uniref:Uncharacterized protein n=1 Tax=Adineta ricciae TaxID=249248 RepID=A0A815R135_ADIRI|nr:unnamed protein product [Adineta ricciae]CAF1471023.1 unnamed protein product [Adineta ricciae]